MDESFIRDAVDESKAKENLLNAVTKLRITWYWCQSAISDPRLKDVSKYISEGYPFNDSIEKVDIKSWCDSVIEKIQAENQISEENQKQYQKISKAFERYVDNYNNDQGAIYPVLHISSYKDRPAIVFHNSYDNYNLIAYIKYGVLEIDNDRGESIYDYAEEQGWSQNDVYYMKHGTLPQGHDEHDSDDMEQDL